MRDQGIETETFQRSMAERGATCPYHLLLFSLCGNRHLASMSPSKLQECNASAQYYFVVWVKNQGYFTINVQLWVQYFAILSF